MKLTDGPETTEEMEESSMRRTNGLHRLVKQVKRGLKDSFEKFPRELLQGEEVDLN